MLSDALSDFIRKRLNELGVTQSDLAKRAGLSRQAVVKLLSGEVRDPQISTVRSLAFALQISPIYLFRLLLERNPIDRSIQLMALHDGDHSSFVADVTIPDGSLIAPGVRFEKIWDIQNTGRTEWLGRRLRCVNYPSDQIAVEMQTFLRPDVREVIVPDTSSGRVARISVWFTAPMLPCNCLSVWKMIDAKGDDCFPALSGLQCVVTVSAA
jgi:transcriptional regulator with XRE-family HTH domain